MTHQQTTLDAFDLVEELGEGATGIVYRAVARDGWKEEFPDQHYALKRYKPSLFLHSDAQSRLQREASLLARIQHLNVVRLHGLYALEQDPFSVYEFFEATDITRAKIDDQMILQVAADLANALLHIHAAEVLHRDVKPENVLYDGHTTKLCDFGVARASTDATMTRDGQFLGTIRYAPPEYLFDGQYTEASDYWGLGQVLYFAFEGYSCVPNLPHFSQQVEAVRRFRFKGLHKSRTLWCRQSFQTIVGSLLDPDPEKRFIRGDLLIALAALPSRSCAEADAIAEYFALQMWNITHAELSLEAFVQELPDALSLSDAVVGEFRSRIEPLVRSSPLREDHSLVREVLSWSSARDQARLTAVVAACATSNNEGAEYILSQVFEFPADLNIKDTEGSCLSIAAALGLVAISKLRGCRVSQRQLLLSYLHRSSCARWNFRQAMIDNGDPGDNDAYAFSHAVDQVLESLLKEGPWSSNNDVPE
ncbi:serine/threonine-protein kinase [Leptolyngbya sp. FACHB-711]|uniref:serine/threonine-protein kinase n=1 Tax=Leptolyngbya sp. FACHB-711 TaxID=2692813 RepID=UPI001687DFA2|nr:serine/threonine-protein kinase [Leptolyngbya sp. FACHB-711]MBD2023794.1 serine/threonine protein kinase [Leptolyngbya sp. FACHB-711]